MRKLEKVKRETFHVATGFLLSCSLLSGTKGENVPDLFPAADKQQLWPDQAQPKKVILKQNLFSNYKYKIL